MTGTIVPRAAHAVKAQIVAAGIAFGDLAEAAGVPRVALSQHVNGRRRVARRQIAIWEAFCRLAKARKIDPPRLGEFWGALLNERLAA